MSSSLPSVPEETLFSQLVPRYIIGGSEGKKEDHRHTIPHSYLARIYKDEDNKFLCNTLDGRILLSSTEPATVIQGAIDYVVSRSGRLFIMDADYICNALGNPDRTGQILTFPSNLDVIGESRRGTKIILGPSVTDKNLVANSDIFNGNENISTKNLMLDASASVNKATCNFNRIKNSVFSGLHVKNGANSSFNFFITGGRDESEVPNYYVDNTIIDRNIFESHTSCSEDNLGGGLLRDSEVTNNIFFNSGGTGAFSQRLMTKTLVSNNVAYDGSGAGFNLEACSDNILNGNIAHNNADAGFKSLFITTGQPDGFSQRNIFNANQSFLNKRGFEIEGPGHKLVANIVRANLAAGIELRDADRCSVICNDVYNNGTDTGLTDTFRAGIRITYQAQSGYTFVGKARIFGNNVYDDQGSPTQKHGILETGSTVDANHIFLNYMENNVNNQLSVVGANTKYWGNVGHNAELYDNPNRALLSIVPSSTAYSTYNVRYVGIDSLNTTAASASNGTESNIQITYPYAFRLKRVIAKMVSNSMNGNTVIGLRDDASTAGSVTVGASTTTEQDSGALDVAVAAGSKIDWIVDTSASSSGNWIIASCIALIVITSY